MAVPKPAPTIIRPKNSRMSELASPMHNQPITMGSITIIKLLRRPYLSIIRPDTYDPTGDDILITVTTNESKVLVSKRCEIEQINFHLPNHDNISSVIFNRSLSPLTCGRNIAE